MEFRVLGPMEVKDGGRAVSLGRPAERHLLALLVCLANEVVPVERLIDELWGEEPPATARNMVQRYVSQLRESLGDTDSTRLATQAGGYRLHIADDELDWCRFETLVIRARDVEDPHAAAALLEKALDLWSGSPFAGAGDGPTVTAERVRMEEAHLTALEERIDRDLDAGCHHELVSELEGLCRRHSLRERLRAQLMVALYRCGRQADALRSYAEYEDLLGEETGLEPGSSLAELESQILVDSSDLGLAPSEPAAPRTNLPHRLTTFVGRRSEIDALIRHVTEHRLVTLTGAGGIGKSSLAVQGAFELLDAFPDGTWLVELVPLEEPTLVGGAIVGALNASVAAGEDTIDALRRHLSDQTALLILDNCEHVVEEAARVSGTLLSAAPNLRILTTSREPLSVPGEAIMRVPPLDVPEDAEQLDPEAIGESEAVVLFSDRARLLRQEFHVDEGNAQSVAEICRSLDGIPLAIELAAARVGTMGLDQIVSGVEDRYGLLTKGARTAPHRHQTLEALVDWSYDLLTDRERVLFRRLAVFAGPFTIEAAEHVCGFGPLTPEAVPDMLDQLVDASLVNPPKLAAGRFRMLETIRQYAYRHLDAHGEIDATMRRIAAYLIEAGPDTEDGYPGSDYLAWYNWRRDEQDSFRAVLAWSIGTGNADVASRAAIEFRGYLVERQLVDEATGWTNGALALLGGEPSRRRLLLLFRGYTSEAYLGRQTASRSEARALYGEAEALGDDGMMGLARRLEAVVAYREGNAAASVDLSAEAIEHFRAGADPQVLDSLWLRAFYLSRLGRFGEARVASEQIVAEIALLGSRGDARYASYSRDVLLALIAVQAGDFESAERLLDAESEYSRRFGAGERYLYLVVAAAVALAKGEPAAAAAAAAELSDAVPETAPPGYLRDAAYFRALASLDAAGLEASFADLREALDYARQDGSVIDIADVVRVVADAAVVAADHDVAVRLHASAASVYERSGIVLGAWERPRHDSSLEALRTVLGDRRFVALWSEGLEMSPTEMLEHAVRYTDTARASSV